VDSFLSHDMPQYAPGMPLSPLSPSLFSLLSSLFSLLSLSFPLSVLGGLIDGLLSYGRPQYAPGNAPVSELRSGGRL
jgi:hypothetical protein